MVKLDDTLVASTDVVSRQVSGDFILLDLESGTYFGINEVGGRLWEILDRQGGTLNQACKVLLEEFEVSAEQLHADVLDLASEMVERGLLLQGERAAP
ncbi:PqqD family protein [Aurantiacibacter poecillastricola]|uniref:PqqD family protein n=1 Tax=Aurantiacibacter poecillastricola TaxID=3064385 RepID=UPI00273E5CC5|nr:PqqD family protein [Aurantiacibacter sp. 219JJ12-13]MDP5260721.1 PqqD family protein [Aurantiacibacter sp. 219JJ12-13]